MGSRFDEEDSEAREPLDGFWKSTGVLLEHFSI